MDPHNVFSVSDIRAAEAPLIQAEPAESNALMRQAAHAVAAVAARLPLGVSPRVALLVGSGGNGGDALYAGAELARGGAAVDAVLLGRGGRVHERGLATFRGAGGTVRTQLAGGYDLVIDGILGIGGSGPISAEADRALHQAGPDALVLAVDVPSGVVAQTGEVCEPHVVADVTVTFGGLRPAHALAWECGEVVLADPRAEAAGLDMSERFAEFTPTMRTTRVNPGPVGLPVDPSPVASMPTLAPGPGDNKYSFGAVGVHAGSADYPGAGLLATRGALRATSSMVRFVPATPDAARLVIGAFPEVVPDPKGTGTVQAAVVGPGRGTDASAERELGELLRSQLPLVIDADALTVLARNPELRAAVGKRASASVLTPHAGEFARFGAPDPASLARELGCIVLLKGRITQITDGARTWTVNAGCSWAATPGSGDVLSGVLGALLARPRDRQDPFDSVLLGAVLHARAAALAAQLPGSGPAPTTASAIADALPGAIADLGLGVPAYNHLNR